MKERPILFSAPMVRALLDGRKTQTRRPVKTIELARGEARGVRVAPNTFCYIDFDGVPGLSWRPFGGSPTEPYPPEKVAAACPYGGPGDRLWVRETWAPYIGVATPHDYRDCFFRASWPNTNPPLTWKPSIHMPRRVSRLTLEVTGVRVERLKDISDEDAMAEGVDLKSEAWPDFPSTMPISLKPQYAFRLLWESINGGNSWAANPWVWVISFRKVEAT